MSDREGSKYSHCPICHGVSEERANGTGMERHEGVCDTVKDLMDRVVFLEEALVKNGLMKEFRQ